MINRYLALLTNPLFILFALYFVVPLAYILMVTRLLIAPRRSNRRVIFIYFMLLLILIVLVHFKDLLITYLPYLAKIDTSVIKEAFIHRLTIFSCLMLLLYLLIVKLTMDVTPMIGRVVHEMMNRQEKIAQQNDLEVRLQSEKAKSTKVVKCPHCGATNFIHHGVGTCQYCRNQIHSNEA